ncbi:MAG: outer membrane beta-barrel protein [Myxococcales bacterium]|nr:outer membrane beta-barrel protein [Myxococcales bacterium]MCB9523273.1 outer membrane beta-barrel protein [Myxococcales bacterium]
MLRITLLAALASLLTAAPALADNTSLITLGLGGQYGFGSPAAAEAPDAARYQYGVLTRVKLLRFIGLEFAAQLDEHPASQAERILSPRFQVGALLHVIPTDWFSLYAAAGLGAHALSDTLNLDGASTSIFVGPGLEVFLGDHLTLGLDVRVRAPGPHHLKREVVDTMSSEPLADLVRLDQWQGNVSLAWYF